MEIGMELQFDRAAGRFSLRSGQTEMAVRGRGADLLAVLIAENSPRYITVDQIHALPGWQVMERDSVGKQVARLIDAFSAKGFAPVAFAKKTNGWRLHPDIAHAIDDDLRARASAWLEARSWMPGGRFTGIAPAIIARWTLNTGLASLAMTAGRADEGMSLLRNARKLADHPDLMAITSLIATRLGQRLSRPHEPIPSYRIAGSVFELSVEAQRQSAYAIRNDSASWHSQVTELKGMLHQIAAVGNFTTLAYIHNALAVLQRRLGEPADALMHITEAAPLAVFSGDITLLQSVMFNFGNILSELADTGHRGVPQDLIIDLLKADVAIRDRFALGNDSAQTELRLAELALQAGATEDAQAYLSAARSVIEISRIPSDEALEARLSGLLRLKRGDMSGLECLDRAIEKFNAIGNMVAATTTTAERDAFADSQGPAAMHLGF